MSRVGRVSDAQAGFTLLETICVMAIVAMLALFALPSPLIRTSRVGLEQLAMRTAALMESDRYTAVRRRATVTTSVDMRARVISSTGSQTSIALPPDVDVRANVSGDCQSARNKASISFYADGRSCGGSLAFNGAGSGFEVRVNWLTGGIEIVATP